MNRLLNSSNRNLFLFSLLIFGISFNYFIFKTEKDSIIIGSYDYGAEIITFIKIILIVPISIISTKLYPKILQLVSPAKALFISILPMTFYLPIFTIIFPKMLQKSSTNLYIERLFPDSWIGFATMINRWDLSIFYVMSELWGSIVLQVAFWGLLNDITSTENAKKNYGILLLSSSTAGIFSGIWTSFVYSKNYIDSTNDIWHEKIKTNLGLAFCINILIVFIFLLIEKLNKEEFKNKIPKESFIEINTLKKCFSNKTIFFLSMSVICMGTITTTSEILWKNMIKKTLVDPCLCSSYLNKISLISNIIGICLGLSFKKSIEKFGWLNTCMIMVLSVSIPSIIMLFSYSLSNTFNIPQAITFSMFIGGIQSTIARSMKTTIYDVTKDFALIPLGRALKASGKAIIDGLMSRIGKVLSSLFFIISLLFLKNLHQCAIPGFFIVLIFTCYWIFSLVKVNKEL